MVEPIHIQTNILGTTEQARTEQALQSNLAGAQEAQAEQARKAHEEETHRSPETNEDQPVENAPDGSGRGRGWMRRRRRPRAESAPDERPVDARFSGKGTIVDLTG